MDDDSFERDLFRARARQMPAPALAPVEKVIARGEARRRVQAVAFVPRVLARATKVLSKTVAPIAMMHAAAGIFVAVAWGSGVHVERVRPDMNAYADRPNMSLEPPYMQGGASDSQLASMPITMRDRSSCDAPFSAPRAQESPFTLGSAGDSMCMDDDRAVSRSCGDFVTCADGRP
jgi:hypothetical protein